MKRLKFENDKEFISPSELAETKKGIIIYSSSSSIYKLHRVENDNYAWVDLETPNCWANGSFPNMRAAINSQNNNGIRNSEILYFETLREFAKWMSCQ